MPTIPITKALGLDAGGKLQEGSRLLSILPKFLQLRDLPLDQMPLDHLQTGLNFAQPLDLSSSGLQLQIGAGAGGRLAILRPDHAVVAQGDPFGEIVVQPNEAYVAITLNFSSTTGVSGGAGPASAGFALQGGFSITCYRRFRNAGQGMPSFGHALGEALAAFVFPTGPGDLAQVPEDSIVAIAGSGSLTVAGDISLATPVQSLASVSLAGQKLVRVNAGGSINFGARFTIESDFEIRLRRVDLRSVELGVYKLKSRSVAASITAQAGATAAVGGFDVAESLIGLLSNQPIVDVAEFRQALPGEDDQAKQRRIVAFRSSLEGSIVTKLQVSLSASFRQVRANDAAWLFRIDLEAVNSTAPNGALAKALRGDFTELTADPARLPAGITQLMNILTDTDLKNQTMRINLLGLLNVLSVAKIAQVSAVERNANGDITLITDTSTASRMQALLQNFNGNAKRLRKLLSENFLIEAAYHVAGVGVLPPEFRSRHTYLEIDESTGREEMKDNLDVACVLGLISRAEQERRLEGKKQFGRATFYAELRYGNDAVRRIFLDGARNPRAVEDYETQGRSALGALLAGDAGQELRRSYADLGMAGNDQWAKMKADGNVANFGPLFGLPKGSTDPRLGAAGADFIVITDWAQAMNRAGAAMAEIEAALSTPVAVSDVRLEELRERLKSRLAEVVSKTHEQFGDPLGMIMVYVASNQDADRALLITGKDIESLEVSALAGKVLTAGA